MNIDKAVHDVNNYFEGEEIRWHDFHEVGADEPYYEWYYAENMLYVIRDRIMHHYSFIHASSPVDAMNQLTETANEIWGGNDAED